MSNVCKFFLLATMMCLQAIEKKSYKLGVDTFAPNFLNKIGLNKKARIGLISNHTGKNSMGQRTVDALRHKGCVITALFAPEHGFDGALQAGQAVAHSHDAQTQLPIFSLYEHGRKKIPHAIFNQIDLFVFDMQDAGMRHYTYIATLLHAMQIAVHHDKVIIVLDRPNPLGVIMQGPVAQARADSFLSSVPLPLRHGMTIGEIARYCNIHVLLSPARLYVAPMKNYFRFQGLDNDLFTNLSPNIKTLAACKGYSFLGLLGEIKPFDVGIGTEFSFTRFGLPEKYLSPVQAQKLAAIVKKYINNASVVSYKRRQQGHRGIMIDVDNINQLDSFGLLLDIVNFCNKEKVPLIFSKYFDVAMGSEKIREYINGTITFAQLGQALNTVLQNFYDKAAPAFIYKPLPRVSLLAA